MREVLQSCHRAFAATTLPLEHFALLSRHLMVPSVAIISR